MGSSPTDSGESGPPSVAHGELFVAIVTDRDNGEETCTISPWPQSERALSAEWVLASGDSFVSLDERR